MENSNDCLVCGKPLQYTTEEREMECVFCHKKMPSRTQCTDGHFICDECHITIGKNAILSYCLKSTSANPLHIVQDMMALDGIHMHGPEHHIMIGCALITAYHNAGGKVDFVQALSEMNARGSRYPGGSCGFWGCCGAAVSVGMSISILTGATPLSGKSWGLSNLATSRVLNRIGAIGGPRCCKRNSFIAITEAAAIFEEYFSVRLELPEKISCSYSPQNHECLRKLCPFYTASEAMIEPLKPFDIA